MVGINNDKIAVVLYLGDPIYFNVGVSVNEILLYCAKDRKISRNSQKGFMLLQNGKYLIPSSQPINTSLKTPIYYRYVDYHTDRSGLSYIDSQCFEYLYHQYKSDIRCRGHDDQSLVIELLSLEILVMAMIFGDPLKPQNYLKPYKELCDVHHVNMESKETKKQILSSLKQFKHIRTEYECMEKYIDLIDSNLRLSTTNKFSCPIILDLAENTGLVKAVVNVYREKLEIFESIDTTMIGSKRVHRELHSIRFSDSKLYIKAAERELKVDIFTQAGRFGIIFFVDDDGDEAEAREQRLTWESFVALLYFYINLEHPRTRREAVQCEITWDDNHTDCLTNPQCAILAPVPPIHHKLTRQDCRMILKRYGTQNGWYMFSTFQAPPRKDESRTNGIVVLTYVMNDTISHMTVNFSQEHGFGPVFYRTDEFRGKKFCSLYEVASYVCIGGKLLTKCVTESMVDDISIPEGVVIPTACLEASESGYFKYFVPLDDKKQDVEKLDLPDEFRFANFRLKEMDLLIRELCDYSSVHENVIRLFGLCVDEKSSHIKIIQEHFGINLLGHLQTLITTDAYHYETLLDVAHQLLSGLSSLHTRQITHGLPVLHSCRYDPRQKLLKIADVGILRISVGSHLEGIRRANELLPFLHVKVALSQHHPARWLPPDVLFEYEFSENSDRYTEKKGWCFGNVLWQLFNDLNVPFTHISNEQLVEQLKKDKALWFEPSTAVSHENKALAVMIKRMIEYCFKENSLGKLLQVFETREGQQDSSKYCYTFYSLKNMTPLDDWEKLELSDVQGNLRFIYDDGSIDVNNRNYNYDKVEDGKNMFFYNTLGDDSPGCSMTVTPERECSFEEDDTHSRISDIDPIRPSDVTITETIGKGQFAVVKKGILKGVDSSERNLEVAIKIYHPDIKAADIEKEINAMNNLRHDYIIPLKGVVRGEETWLVMNFYVYGSLKKYIEQNPDLPIDRLTLFATQIAEGMQYLADKNFVHRDLSSRNVLVESHRRVRIADLGLSRSIEKQYYKSKTNSFIPYLWYPPELFETKTYGKSLDVWSYGITCYEIFNNAEIPYWYCNPPITEIAHLLEFFKRGNRLPLPIKAPPHFKTVIQNCWKEKSERWNFNDIVRYLREKG